MVRIAVVGAGRWGERVLRALGRLPEARVSWIIDRDPSRLAAVGRLFPAARAARDFGDALASDDVDAVVVAAPASLHHAMARDALARGKDVLVEKPLALDVEQAEELCTAARAGGLILMVGHVYLFHPAIRYIGERVRSPRFGPVKHLSLTRAHLGPIRKDVGAVWDLAAHDVAIADHWLGDLPATAAASGFSWLAPGREDLAAIRLRYPGGTRVDIHISWLSPWKTRRAVVLGERGMIAFDELDAVPVRVYDRSALLGASRDEPEGSGSRSGQGWAPAGAPVEPLVRECRHFVRCVARRERPVASGEHGLAVVRTLAAVESSLALGGREVPVATRREGRLSAAVSRR
ncbi:MAG: Gfo/Idh/MocA family oxidoreductase [Elusimicrobia bacterium]|nr:Gfo/Idh/MocA family oxidoreductase [Elusimicrobiota bacterium]